MRAALEAYLRSIPPAGVVRDGAPEDAGCGRITVDFDRGSICLVPAGAPDASGAIRLLWRKGDRNPARPVPAGSWQVLN